ncbi:MAG: ATP-binding protein [Ilumatobacter sp.]
MNETVAAGPMASVRPELRATAVSIAVGRAVLRRVVTFRDPDAESSFLIAFTEIMTNAVDEHVRLASDRPIVVEIEQTPHDLVRVNDSGAGMSDESLVTSAPDGSVERGRGLALARAFVDDIAFESSPSGTIVSLPLAGFGIIR